MILLEMPAVGSTGNLNSALESDSSGLRVRLAPVTRDWTSMTPTVPVGFTGNAAVTVEVQVEFLCSRSLAGGP